MKQPRPRPLDKTLTSIFLLRLILPSLILILLTIGLIGHLVTRGMVNQQLQLAHSLSQVTDDYLEHASRVLGTVARMAEMSTPEQLTPYVQTTWQEYGYFDTLYWLDESGIVVLLVPPDPQYLGQDMSHQPYFRQAGTETGETISQPFSSPRTGQPAVYMTLPLTTGGLIVGELGLGALQETITSGRSEIDSISIFITDHSGTLLAHPRPDLVAQQTNVGHLDIVQRGAASATTSLYSTDEGLTLGSAAPSRRCGWIIVVQERLLTAYAPYIQVTVPLILLAPVVWTALLWSIRQHIDRHVVAPLTWLSQGADALTAGDFAQSEALTTIPAAFTEVDALGANFHRMSRAIQARQAALQESEEKYRTILENIEDGYYEVDVAGNFTFFNDAMCRILGYTKDELVGMNNRQYMSEEGAKEAYRTINVVYQTGKPAQAFDWELIRKDGARRFIEASTSLIKDSAGESIGFRGICRDVTERKQAEEEIRQRTAQLEALRQVGLELTAQLGTDDLLRSIASRALELLGGTSTCLYLCQPNRDVLEEAVAVGTNLVSGKKIVFSRGEDLPGQVWETGEPLIVNDYHHWEGRVSNFEGHSFTATVGVPIRWQEEFLGVLMVVTDAPQTFSPADAELLSLFATQAAIAIRNARLYEEAHSRAEELAVLNELTQALAACLNVEAVLGEAYRGASRLLDTTNFYIGLYDPERNEVFFRFDVSESGQDAHITVLPADQGLAGYIVRTRKSVLIRENLAERLAEIGVALVGEPALSWLGVPLMIGNRVLGVIAVQSYTTPHAYDEHDQELLTAIASQTAVALENARLFQAEREQRELAEALEEAAAAVSSTLDLDEVLDHILEQIEQVIPGDAFNIMLIEDSIARVVRWRGYKRLDKHVSGSPIPIAQYPNLTKMVETGEPILIPNTATNPDWVPRKDLCWLNSYIAAPIRLADETVGFLNVNGIHPNQFGPNDARRLQALTSHAATAIENARLFEETQQRMAELEALQRTSLQLTSSLDLPAVLNIITTSALTLVGATDCHIYLYDETTETFTFGAALWEDGRREAAIKSLRPHGLTATVAREGHPIVINDAPHHPLYASPQAQKWGVRSIAGFPLKWSGRILGVFNIAFLTPHTFSQEEMRVLGLLADQAAVAIENAQLHRQLKAHAEKLEQHVQERTAQIQAQYAQQEAILRNASDGIIVTDAEGEIIQTNPVAQTWLTQTLSPEDVARLQETVQNLVRQTEERSETILELTGLDLELKAAPILEPRMKKAAAVVAVHDVSHLKALNRMKSRFVANISHELRTPITTIKLYAALMQKTPPEDEKWKKYLDTLTQEADHQARLVEDILQISHIDAGRLEMNPRPISLNELTNVAVVSHQALAESQGLNLEHRPTLPVPGGTGEDDPVVLVDPERMMQVLNNLLGNAIHYTPEGGKVTVSTGVEEAKERVWATATVVDTGMGIPAEEFPHIFERFFRGAEPRSMQISGTGLGLAIVKEIVELHGGWVTVRSEANVGTSFTIWLPLANQKYQEPSSSHSMRGKQTHE
ncbi:MAG: GAF domain-containing protein [Chloroflexota bacterium]|nr:GAF domain-containing protein [Chloroflexota bacterium]